MDIKLTHPNHPSTASAEPATQPGVSELRDAVANRVWQRLPRMAEIRRNGIAGLTIAIAELPDGMANGILAGVNPVFGLYGNIVGPIVAGLVSSTQLLTVVTTSAASLTVGLAVVSLPPEVRPNALFLTVLLSGILQVFLGLLGAGRLIRFVSYSVMTGFLAGIGVLLILSQLPTVTGIAVSGGNKVSQTFELVSNINGTEVSTFSVASLTMLLAVLLPRTKIGHFGTLVAVGIPSMLVAILQINDVDIVRGVSEISGGLPTLHIPSFSAVFTALPAAFALAAIVLIQGAGVSQSVPNPDGSRSRVSRDFVAQGAANIASGLFRGIAVGGSLSATTLTVVAGASRRSAVIFAGLWLMIILAAVPRLVELIAMPSLGALLVLVGVRSVARSEIQSIWSAGWTSSSTGLATFFATLLLPIEAAIGLGVALSGVHYLFASSSDVSIVELVKLHDGRIEEHEPPKELEGNRVAVFDVHGHLFYAGARTLERKLPRPGSGKNPAVVLRLRGQDAVGATLIDVLSKYVSEIGKVEGRLYITGVEPKALQQLRDSHKLQLEGPVQVFEATPILGESTSTAKAQADAWLVDLVTGD